MNYLIRKTFERRGLSADYIADIDRDTLDLYKDEDALCARLHQARLAGELITILPDFDTDGICSGICGYAGLSEMGFHVALYIPHPEDGYEFTQATIDRLLAEHPQTSVILTCDVGISCYAGVAYAASRGLTVLVTDHHAQNDKDTLRSPCVVDPMRLDESVQQPRVCGAYVLYHVLSRYAELYCDGFTIEQVRRLRVFAGIGTVSDGMPLHYCNRQLVRDSVSISQLLYSDGMDDMVNAMLGHPVYRRAFYGLYVLYCVLAEHGKISCSGDITEELYGFYLAPMINSMKRMEADVRIGFDIFFGPDPRGSADRLFQLNDERKVYVREKFEELQAMDQPYAPCVYFSHARSGVVGLLASKVMQSTGHPCVVLSDNGLTGSGRSFDWYPLMSRARAAGFYADGHDPAFGIGFTDRKEIKSFAAFLSRDFADTCASVDFATSDDRPDFIISTIGDGDTGIDIMCFAEYLRELENYRPFGNGFPVPDVLLRFSLDDPSVSFRTLGKAPEVPEGEEPLPPPHLKVMLPYGFNVLLWNQSEKAPILADKSRHVFEVRGHLSRNVYNDSVSIQFMGDLLVPDA